MLRARKLLGLGRRMHRAGKSAAVSPERNRNKAMRKKRRGRGWRRRRRSRRRKGTKSNIENCSDYLEWLSINMTYEKRTVTHHAGKCSYHLSSIKPCPVFAILTTIFKHDVSHTRRTTRERVFLFKPITTWSCLDSCVKTETRDLPFLLI